MEVIEEGPENIKILLKDSDRAYANALRRTLMSDTPKMAIEVVRFQMGSFDLCPSARKGLDLDKGAETMNAGSRIPRNHRNLGFDS